MSCRSRLALLGLGLALAAAPQRLRAEPLRPQPPASVPLQLDPDPTTCTPALISQAFAQHLRPWADQPAEVLDRLRQLQADMTRASIARCVRLGWLTPEQATALQAELGLQTPRPQPSNRP